MSDMLLETIEMLCSPEAEIMPDGVRLTKLIRAANEAATLITSLREALEWYEINVTNCRKITSEGNDARHALDKDGGNRARTALNPSRKETI